MTELLSVVLPTHERPERLREAARSVLDQDYPAIELVVVDDGSSEPTARVLDELCAQNRRLVVVRHDEPRGSSAARNAGLAAASGELVAFCDDDDRWLAGAAASAVAALGPTIGVAYGWHEVLHEATGRLVTFRPPEECNAILMRWVNVPAILSGVVRRSMVGDALVFDTDLYTSEDWDLWLRCADRAPMAMVAQPLYRYVQHREDRVTDSLAGHAEGHQRFLDKHRSSMSSACIAHHELAIALATHDRQAVTGQLGRLLVHPGRTGGVALMAGQLLASRVGRKREDPGLPLRFAAKVVAACTGPVPVDGRAPARPPRSPSRSLLSSRPPIGAFWGWAQVTASRTSTAELVSGSALVLSPHPDDETIGCGLLVAEKVAAGQSVTLALATDGRAGWYSRQPRPSPEEIAVLRHHEWHRALDALGVPEDHRVELGFPDSALGSHEGDLVSRIAGLLHSLSPTQVFVAGRDDPHPDHRALARATRQAVVEVYGHPSESATPGRPMPAVYSYRVYPGAGLWPEGHPPRATLVMTIRELGRSVVGLVRHRPSLLRAPGRRSAKVAAIRAHESQRLLLDGELRYVWGTGTELFQPVDVWRSDGPHGSDPLIA